MRIGYFIDTEVFGGAEAMMLPLAEGAKKAGFAPIVYRSNNSQFEARLTARGLDHKEMPCSGLYKKGITLPIFAAGFARQLRRDGISLLHSHLFGPTVGGALASALARVPHVATLHDVYMVQDVPSRIRQLRLAVRLGTKLVAVSDDMLNYYREAGRFSGTEIERIYNGLSRPPAPPVERNVTRARLGLSDEDIVLIVVGRLVKLKNHQLLFHALARVPAVTGVRLLVAGDGPEAEDLATLQRELRLEDRIKMLGYRDDIASLLAASDTFVLTSTTEGLSCSIMEAMSWGLPVLATNVGGNCELVTDNGFLVPDNPDTLAARISALASDGELRHTLGRRSLARYQQLFAEDHMIRSYVSLYRSRLGAPSGE